MTEVTRKEAVGAQSSHCQKWLGGTKKNNEKSQDRNFPGRYSNQHIHLTMSGSWLEKYGPVVGLLLGSAPLIAVSGPHAVLEVLRRDEFHGRPDSEEIRERSFNKRLGILLTDGPFWVEHRRFTIKHLKDFGFGKKSAEAVILEETEQLMIEMKEMKVVQVSGLFNIPSVNVLWSMIAGTRYAHDDADFKLLLHKLNSFFRSGSPAGNLATIFPVLKKIAPELCGHKKKMEALNELTNFFRKTIHEHKLMLEENNPRDFMDVYLQQMEAEKADDNSTFTEEGLIVLCLDLFSAGAESLSNALSFCLLYMVLHPRVQEAVQKEVDTVIGRSRRPSLEDRTRLPYVEATISEISRINPIAPITLPHTSLRDTELCGYTIKENTTILVNIWSVLHDREHWSDPEVFRPERFLDADGKFVKDERLIPFGVGKRVCLGEILAKDMLFLMFTNLMQEFTFRTPEEDPYPTTDALPGFITAPAPFRVQVTER
ncbi:hypothetical protein Cfor_09782 [Coptotermes formosanus]|uniref:Cytochrome P450 n=1 Tax=Coptotermes formosanus TaxID=36987 RepID=A0A6L2Q747_COPFO|nr:hypothetical protein Cfor_09782 [Coptotermes formosanus]